MRRRTWYFPPALVALLFAFYPPAASAWFILLPASIVAAVVLYRRELAVAPPDDAVTVEAVEKMEVNAEEQKSSTMETVIDSPSWGAAVTMFVYLIAMRVYKSKAGLIWLIALFVAPVLWVVLIIFPWSFFVLKAKHIAWQTREWRDFDDFLACQRIWDRWSKGIVAIAGAAIVVSIFM